MADIEGKPPEPVASPCVVEAIDGVVIVECGAAAATLTDDIARQAGAALQKQGEIAREQAADRGRPAGGE